MVDLQEEIDRLGVTFRQKAGSRLMRVIALVMGDRFMSGFWTTIAKTIYFPTAVRDPLRHPKVIEHELAHVRQWRRWGPILWITYLLLPLPVGLAWFRWRWEREAYLVDIENGVDYEWVVHALWRGYAWPWPRSWMRSWFERELHKRSTGTT